MIEFPPDSAPHVYIMLGTIHSGRRRIISDMITGLLPIPPEGCNVTLTHANEKKLKGENRDVWEEIGDRYEYRWDSEQGMIMPDIEVTAGSRIFFVLSSIVDIVEQLQWINQFFKEEGLSLTRVLSCIDIKMAFEKEELMPFFDALVHFSDYVFITNRSGVPGHFTQKFVKKFEKECYPCSFEMVKKFKVANPAEVLFPESRRVSHFFDNLDPWDTLEVDEDNLPDEPFELKVKDDPYMERDDSGNLVKPIPNPSSFY